MGGSRPRRTGRLRPPLARSLACASCACPTAPKINSLSQRHWRRWRDLELMLKADRAQCNLFASVKSFALLTHGYAGAARLGSRSAWQRPRRRFLTLGRTGSMSPANWTRPASSRSPLISCSQLERVPATTFVHVLWRRVWRHWDSEYHGWKTPQPPRHTNCRSCRQLPLLPQRNGEPRVRISLPPPRHLRATLSLPSNRP
jgi:hypothetical protein